MSTISTRGHDVFEIQWSNGTGDVDTEFCVSIDHAKMRSREIQSESGTDLRLSYFLQATIEESQTRAFQPSRRFGERQFDADELAHLHNAQINELRDKAFCEFDLYMTSERGMKPLT